MKIMTATAVLAALVGIAHAGAPDPERDVQIRSINLETNVVEIHNFGATAMPLDGWRFCTHSASQVRRYTGANALNGESIAAGGSLLIYMGNDSPGGANEFNASDLGNFANDFGQGPYAMELFWPNGGTLTFGSTDDMVDHIQWDVNGTGSAVADQRSQQAVNAGLWTDATAWISTSGNSLSVTLDPAGGLLHGPDDYTVTEPALNCNDADIAEPFGILDLADINAFISAFGSGGEDADIAEPFGVLDLADINAFISAFTAGCP